MNTIAELENTEIAKVLMSDGSTITPTEDNTLRFQHFGAGGNYIVSLSKDGKEIMRFNANFVVSIVWKTV